MKDFNKLYKKLMHQINESFGPVNEQQPKYTISWEYSSEYGDFDSGEAKVDDLGEYGSIQEFVECEYPEDDAECGGYCFVEVKDANGDVIYERGEHCQLV